MTSRPQMDRPAQVTAALLGVVLIVVSLALFQIVPDEDGGNRYTIAWTQAEHGNSQANLGSAGTTIRVPVTMAQPSNATIEFPTCNDGFTAPVQNAAVIAWSLFEGDNTTAIQQGTTTCASAAAVPVSLGPHADIGELTANSADEAKQTAEGRTARTTSYRLEVSWSRATGTVPVLPPPTFSASAKLTIQEWVAAANPVTQEATR